MDFRSKEVWTYIAPELPLPRSTQDSYIFLIKVRQVKEKEDAAERRCTNLTEANEKMKKEVRICTHNQM